MTNSVDDLEAVRTLVAALEPFNADDRERIIRWAREKLGLPASAAIPSVPTPPLPSGIAHPSRDVHGESRNIDIKTFVESKKPMNDVQFAATVAYYRRFEAPVAERKDAIASTDLEEACRKVNRERLKNPGQTLRNAHQLGLLDKGNEKGTFIINSVGENLVAMTLPQKTAKAAARRPKAKSGRSHKARAKKKPKSS